MPPAWQQRFWPSAVVMAGPGPNRLHDPTARPWSRSIPEQAVPVGESVTVSVAMAFNDPDGDALAHAVKVSDPQLVGAAVRAGTLELVAHAQGTVTVAVEATDTEGLSATLAFPGNGTQ